MTLKTSSEQPENKFDLERFKGAYERQRKAVQRKEDRLKEVFDQNLIAEEVEKFLAKCPFNKEDVIELIVTPEWNKEELFRKQWLTYVHSLFELREGWKYFNFTVNSPIVEEPRRRFIFKKEISPRLIEGRVWRNGTIKSVKEYLDGFFYPGKSLHLAKYLNVEVKTPRKQFSLSSKSKKANPIEKVEYRDKNDYQDFITFDEIPMVLEYYGKIFSVNSVYDDVFGRGLTVSCAVKKGEGESIVRRNDNRGQRLVVYKIEDALDFISDFLVYRFVPDVNLFGEKKLSKIPFDFDTPIKYFNYEKFRDFINDFKDWLVERGFKPKVRKTGGNGAHVILEMDYCDVPRNYLTQFPRSLKFDTWYSRLGKTGAICASAADFVKTTILGFATYRKMEMGKPSAITIEEQIPQRVRNIYVDWSRATVDMGIVGLGSIKDSNGKVCLPVKQLPEKDTLDDTIKVSNDPSVKVQATFDQKFKSPWMHTIYQNPHLLEEKKLSVNDNPMSLVEEIFKDFNWIPNKYIELGSEKFLRKYCW